MRNKIKSNINIDVKKLMQSGAYENVIYGLMETSSLVFPGHYEHIEKQPNKECDFIEITNKIKKTKVK